MTMGSKLPICKLCVKRINRYGTICLTILGEICKTAIEEGFIYYHEKKSSSGFIQIISFLEHKGLLVTTEWDKYRVFIRPNIRKGGYDSKRACFCWCEERTSL